MTDYDLDKVARATVAELAALRHRAAVNRVLGKARETVGDTAYTALLPQVFSLLLDQIPRVSLALVLPELIGAVVVNLPSPDDDVVPVVASAAPRAVTADGARALYLAPHLDDKESLR